MPPPISKRKDGSAPTVILSEAKNDGEAAEARACGDVAMTDANGADVHGQALGACPCHPTALGIARGYEFEGKPWEARDPSASLGMTGRLWRWERWSGTIARRRCRWRSPLTPGDFPKSGDASLRFKRLHRTSVAPLNLVRGERHRPDAYADTPKPARTRA